MNTFKSTVAAISLAFATQAGAQQTTTRNIIDGICGPTINGNTVVEYEFNKQRAICIAELLSKCGPEVKGTTGAEDYANKGVRDCRKEASKK